MSGNRSDLGNGVSTSPTGSVRGKHRGSPDEIGAELARSGFTIMTEG